jgi:hypothetical protein
MSPLTANESVTVRDPNLGIMRKVIAGQPVPPELEAAYRDAVGDDVADQQPGEAADDNRVDYDAWSADDVAAEVERLGLEVEGTGANGNVTKADRVKALKAHGAA